jgi:hypothetical protein
MFSLGSYIFLDDESQWFAAASGDYNPIHVDPVAARRLISGKQVVHGMHTILAALNCYYRTNTQIPERLQAYFPKPIFVGDEVQIFYENINSETRIFVRNAYEEVASIRLIGSGRSIPTDIINMRPDKRNAESYSFSELKDLAGKIQVMAELDDLELYFSDVSRMLGAFPVATFMTFSRIVGMEAPGLNSLFTGLNVKFNEPNEMPLLWKVTRHRSSFAPIQVQVEAEGVHAVLDVFVRPAPIAQASMLDVKKIVNDESFAEQRALVIGGSRGLGEVVAKCVATGGGEVLVTYASGENEALGVRDAITHHGGSCEILKLDVTQLRCFESVIDTFKPTHMYYFASGRISNNANSYNSDLYDSYAAIYLNAFSAIARQIASNSELPVRLFYPSSVFVSETPDGFAEYAKAKMAGERECHALEAEFLNLDIFVKRLPMLKTDQTASLIPVAAKPALPEMLQVVREMNTM